MRRFGGAKIDEARKLVTCSEILDANRWRGEWHGQTFECRALPDTTYLTVGSAAFCHVLPGTSELVAVWPPVKTPPETLYFAINKGTVAGPVFPSSDLYVLDSLSGPPAVVWTSSDFETIRQLAWTNVTHRLYIFTRYTGDEDYFWRIYEFNTSDNIATLVYEVALIADWSNLLSGGVAEFGDKLFIVNGTWHNSYLWRFDPVSHSVDTVNTIAALGGDPCDFGGVAALNGKLVHCSGEVLHESSTGDPGSFTQVANIKALWTRQERASELTTHNTDGRIYFLGGMCLAGANDHFVIYSWDGSTLAAEYDILEASNDRGSLGIIYSGDVAGDIVACGWRDYRSTFAVRLHGRFDGVWGLDYQTPAGWFNDISENLIQFDGEICWLVNEGAAGYPVQITHLYRRTAPGAVTDVTTWTPVRVTGAMTLAWTNKLCHEI